MDAFFVVLLFVLKHKILSISSLQSGHRRCSKIVLKMSDLQTKVVKVAVIPPSPLMDISTMVDLFFKVLHSHEFLVVFIYIILFCKPSKTNLHQTQPAHLLKYTS